MLRLQQGDRRLELTARLAHPRNQALCERNRLSMLRQRGYGRALGYEDLNEDAALRVDPAIQTAVGTDPSGITCEVVSLLFG